jgi:hypothetical protein
MAHIANIVSGLRVLYMSANGCKTFGVTVEALGSTEKVEKLGYARQWLVNDHSILTDVHFADTFGLSEEQHEALRTAVRELLQENLERAFDAIYARLAAIGACDGLYGREYQRVYAEWVQSERPSDTEAFIRRRANAIPVSFATKLF